MNHVRSARLLSLFFGLLLTIALVTPSSAAVDMFLEFGPPDGSSAPQIVGESEDKDFKDAIDVLAWSWGASNSSTFADGQNRGVGRPNFQDLSITKYIDKGSAPLMAAVATGAVYSDLKLSVRKAGGEQVVYVIIELKDVRITSYSTGGSGGEDRLTENVSINFSAAKVTYTPQNELGEAGPPIIFEWNQVTQSPDFDGNRSNPVSSNSAPVSTGVSVTVKD